MSTADLICTPCKKCKAAKEQNRKLQEKVRYLEETLAYERISAAVKEQRRVQRES